MARRIQVLPDTVANQIAAGEVVERPASVVKELVENALDAGARDIEVSIEVGGKRLIRVADDGEGMSREDALLCLDRHATSKITAAEDLKDVPTFGFRGEALPSIAAVSRLTLETATDEDSTRLRSTGGRILDVEDAARRRGTTVEVKRLFFNAPARAKFLKTPRVETRAVSEVLHTVALAHPEVGLRLLSGDRVLLDVPSGEEMTGRVARLWGDDVVRTLLPIRHETDAGRMWGLAQRPDAAESGPRRGGFFLGRRSFRDPDLVKAVGRGYRTTLPRGVHPWFVLHLELAAGAADVNVHPAKAEIRFRDPEAVRDLVESGIRAGMATEASSATLDTDLPRPAWPDRVAERPASTTGSTGGSTAGSKVPRDEGRPSGGTRDQMALFVTGGPSTDADDRDRAEPGETEESGAAAGDRPVRAPERPRLWQVHNTWIFAETRDGLLIIDQHSAHERVLFHRLMRAYEEGGETSQRLLFPLTLRLRPEELAQVEEVSGLLRRAGFEVEPFGTDTVVVHATPNPHPYFDAARCFREMVTELTEGRSDLMQSARNQHERIAMTFACKGAIKAGQRLSDGEMQELFDALFATELPHHDVHGRPTIVRLGRGELERKFGR
ncbi:MAG TPA: DNA mismatch repair endonuclease MutL [Longimicrobiales bacterium]|nr:DNA mismatch repair endonuclease MutL [Longimicrobiales bacterium]